MSTCDQRFQPLRAAADVAIASRDPDEIDAARSDLIAFTRDPANAPCDEQRREARQLIIRLDLAEQPTRNEMIALTERIEAAARRIAPQRAGKPSKVPVRKATKKKKVG
jgi:hypothetical protein